MDLRTSVMTPSRGRRRVAGGRARDARRARGAAPVAHDPALPAGRRPRRARRRRLARVLRAAGARAARLHRGDRAAPARPTSPGAGEHRAPARCSPTCRCSSAGAGEPPFGDAAFEQLVDVVDRLVVDSREWEDAPGCYAKLVEYFERVAVSDIVWARTLRWRRAIAERWPLGRELQVRGPIQEAALLAGWLRSQLDRDVELRHEPATGSSARARRRRGRAREERWTPSDLLSHELDRFSRDPVYEAAVAAL